MLDRISSPILSKGMGLGDGRSLIAMQLILDYEALRVICWACLGLLLISFVVVGSLELGAGIVLPFLAMGSMERGYIFQTIIASWKGGQIFLVLMGGLLYFAWPTVFLVSAYSFSFLLIFLFFILLLVPLGIYLRNKLRYKGLYCYWDKSLFFSSILTVFILGVIFGNLLIGIPFSFNSEMEIEHAMDIRYLFNSFSVLTGGLAISMVGMQASVYLQIKLTDKIRWRANRAVYTLTLITLFLFTFAGYRIFDIAGYHLVSEVFSNEFGQPIASEVKKEAGLWLDNYGHLAGLLGIPVTVFISAVITMVLVRIHRRRCAFIFSSITMGAIILTAGCSLFPFIIPSSTSPNSSLTVWDSSASLVDLTFIFYVISVSSPFVLVYFGWFFRGLSQKF